MKTQTKNSIFYVFPAVLLIAACMCTGSSSGIEATVTPVPLPSEPPAIEATATREPTAAPTVAAGSFEDFQLFAAKIAAALQDKNTSFFDEYAATSTWTCLGDETFGVCKDKPADTTLEGIPVTDDWATYEVYNLEAYRETWQTRFADGDVLKLAAVANKFGEYPLMPMASQSFLAIVSVADESDPASIQEVHVLFFEYRVNTWYLAGELVSTEQIESWLTDACPTCYDRWAAWPQ